MKEIILNTVQKTSKNYRKFIALIDDEDFERVNQYNWTVFNSKTNTYAVTAINNKNCFMHNFIMGFKGVDHINGNGLDCQKINLRKATQQQNNMNTKSHKDSSSKHKGVCYFKRNNNWRTQIAVNNKNIHIGYFNTEIEAAKAYNEAAKKYHKNFARLNKIGENE